MQVLFICICAAHLNIPCAYNCVGLCRFMDSAKLLSSSTECKEWCVSTNMTVLSDQVKTNKHTVNKFKYKNSRYYYLKSKKLSYQKRHLVPQSPSKYLDIKQFC